MTFDHLNKVATSGIVALDLLDYKPILSVIPLDLKEHLYMEMIVKEKEFRASVAELDNTCFKDKAVAVFCSTDAIIPDWAYMVIADKLTPDAAYIDFCNPQELHNQLWSARILQADLSHFTNKKVVVKSRPNIAPELFMAVTQRLKPLVKTLMYGEIGLPKVILKN